MNDEVVSKKEIQHLYMVQIKTIYGMMYAKTESSKKFEFSQQSQLH